MMIKHDYQTPAIQLKELNRRSDEEVSGDHGHAAHDGHGWTMILVCIPMLVIPIVLVATGILGIGFLIFAVISTAVMALMLY